MHFSVRPGFHGEGMLDSFNLVISGMKTTIYTKYMNSKFFYSDLEKWIFAILSKRQQKINNRLSIVITYIFSDKAVDLYSDGCKVVFGQQICQNKAECVHGHKR